MSRFRSTILTLAGAVNLALLGSTALANSAPQTLPFTQNWADPALISAADNWDGVPGVIGYLGDIDPAATAVTNIDPQTLLLDYSTFTVDVIPNLAVTTSTAGGVGEFEITNPVVGMQGSATADAPNLLIHLNTSNRENIRVQYNVRDIDGGTDNAAQQVALHYRIGATGSYLNVPAAYIADATTISTATQVTAVDIMLPPTANNQPLVMLRIMTTNAAGADEWVGIDDFNVSGDGLSGFPVVSVADAQVTEGNVPGQTSNLVFNISLSAPAPVGGTRFDATTTDGSASVGDSDYVGLTLNDVLIPEGQISATVTVMVNHDLIGEPNETLTLTLSDLVNGLSGDVTAVGTIVNDDPLEIFQIQGSGLASTLVGSTVLTNNNVVTALAPNGFFIQTPTARDDGNLATSNGIFVFTATPPTVAVGEIVNVSGNVQEFFEFTQISGTLSITVTSSGASLPAPVMLDANFPSPLLATPSCFTNANPEAANFECIEGMRATLNNAVVNGPNQRFSTDPLAEPHIVASGDRAFREPGIPTPGFVGIAASIPIWDKNPEVFEIDPDKLGLPNLAMTGGTRFNAVGVIGYDFSDYEFWPTSLTVTQAVNLPVAVDTPSVNNLTIGSINMFRMFDDNQANNINSSTNCSGVPTCTSLSNCGEVAEAGDYARRLAKFSTYIRKTLKAPDVVGVQEVENIGVLQALVAKIAIDDPSLIYSAHLEEGSDVGGIDSGFLVRTTRINAGFTVVQLSKAELFNFDSPPSCLHDRPPLRLDGVFSVGNKPFSVIVNHTRSLLGIGDCRGASQRLCRKRLAQAESIATIVQLFQTTNPAVPLVVIGDHNGFQFTDGHVDVMGIIRGTATLAASGSPDSQVAPTNDIVEPNMTDGISNVPVQQRYSYFFDRTLQVIDHALMTAPAQTAFVGMSFGRANVDAPIAFERSIGDSSIYGDDMLSSGFEEANEWNPIRVSDHDGFVIRLFE